MQSCTVVLSQSKKQYACRCGCGRMPASETLELVCLISAEWGEVICASGARCEQYTKTLRKRGYKAAEKSAHAVGLAIDLVPVDGRIKEFHDYCISRLDAWDAYMEDPEFTPHHAHLQLRRAKQRVFKPGKLNAG